MLASICVTTMKGLPALRHAASISFCARCGKAVAEARDVYCSDCRSREHDFDAGRSLLVYTDAAARMIARYKFHNQRYYADWFAEQMAARLADDIRAMGADTLVPVPMYEKKRLARGFDQTLLLAEKLAEHTGLRVRRLLTRTKETRPMKDLGYEDRLLNVISALDIAPDAGPVPERVIVTDDIYTTGSTVDAFARVLKKAGAKKVYFLAAAAGRD